MPIMPNDTVDIAIVGAGVSGVYTAWRLKEHDPTQKIVVYESSCHVGGRLLSLRPPEIPNMVAELGGMRILPAVQPLIKSLIVKLNKKLPCAERIDLYDFPVDQPQNLAYLRGTYLRLSDFEQHPEKVPYSVTYLERGMSAGKLIINAIEQIVPGITRADLSEEDRRVMARDAEFGGVKLYKQGFWNVLMRIISGEGYLLGIDAGGYNSTLSNWNAADAIPWFLSDFGVNAKYQGFRKGFQQVPLSLAKLFKDLGGEVYLDRPLVGFDQKEGEYELTFKDQPPVRAKALILAMPRRSLELIAPKSPPLQGDQLSDWIRSVTPRPLFKLFTTYANPWWRAAGFYKGNEFIPVEAGRTVTDLPVRQTYYWPKDDGTPAQTGPSMLMASYDDGTNIGFWDGLRRRRGLPRKDVPDDPVYADFEGPGDKAEVTSCPGSDDWHKYRAPKRMVLEVARQLATIHGLSHTPEVRSAAYRDWGDDPFGGGWNSWNIGVRSKVVKQHIVQPFPGERFHICGEAYSDAQGWVEGALQTADMVLQKFGLGTL
jgi:monoamine oxidase